MLFLETRQKIKAISPLISEKSDKMSWPIRFEGIILFHYSGLSDLVFQTNLSVENELVKLNKMSWSFWRPKKGQKCIFRRIWFMTLHSLLCLLSSRFTFTHHIIVYVKINK